MKRFNKLILVSFLLLTPFVLIADAHKCPPPDIPPDGYKQAPLTPEMKALIKELRVIVSNPVVQAAYNDAVANVQPVVAELGQQSKKNPWAGTNVDDFVCYFQNWFTFLPSPTGGLGKIVPLTWFYLNNQPAYYFMNNMESKSGQADKYSKEIFNWTVKFVKARGKFMDSPASAQKYIMKQWLDAPSTQIWEYKVPKGGYNTFNEFFTRQFKDQHKSRPIRYKEDDSIVVSSADVELNFIQSDLTLETNLNVKSRQINVGELLDDSPLAKHFVGGTAVSGVLMPNNYHHYHAPVNGHIVESKEIKGIYNGIKDGEHWFNQGNIGESTTDFSIFEDFHRAYYIIKTKNHGHVAVIPVGLNTISKIETLIPYQSKLVAPGGKAVKVMKGDELGHFAYGGSLNILLFEKGVFNSLSVLMGQRIGVMNAPSKPENQ